MLKFQTYANKSIVNAPLHLFKFVVRAFEKWGINLMGPLP